MWLWRLGLDGEEGLEGLALHSKKEKGKHGYRKTSEMRMSG